MARWTITVEGKGLQRQSLEKLITQLQLRNGLSVHVVDASPPESRQDRFDAAMSDVSDAASEVESLRDELQEWHDNLPENLQQGSKADEIQEAIDALEEVHDALEQVDGSSVSFPGMY